MGRLFLLVLTMLPTSTFPGEVASDRPRHRGVCFVVGPREFDPDAFNKLVALHVNWISVSPFGWMRNANDPTVALRTGRRTWWGESDEGLKATFADARRHGIRVLLSPHIWMRPGQSGGWRGSLAFESEMDWLTWERDYRAFIMHYAGLAAEEGVEAFSIGTELQTTVRKRPEFWRSLIQDVRSVYKGRVTYAANWYEEFEEVGFWDAVDFVGIQAYFPLVDSTGGPVTLEALEAGWVSHVAKIEAFQKRVGKPIVFTEVGYRSTDDAAVEPWLWGSEGAVADDVQAACYEAMFRTFWERPWFAGAYFWKWYPYPERRAGGRARDFTPQGKPSEAVMARWYGGGGENAKR